MRVMMFLLALSISISAFTQTSDEWKTLTLGDLSIQCPSGWNAQDVNDSTFVVFVGDPLEEKSFRELITVVQQDFKGKGSTLSKFVKVNEDQLKTTPGCKITESRRVSTPNGEYHLMMLTMPNGSETLKVKLIFRFANDHGYAMTFISTPSLYDSSIAMVDKVMDSIQLKK